MPVKAPPAPPLRVNLNQKMFAFESAKLQQVEDIQVEKKSGSLVEEISGWLGAEVSGWLGGGEKKAERSTNSLKVNGSSLQVQKTTGKAKYFQEDLGNGIGLEMVYIPAGTFMMGSLPAEDGSSDSERPQHLVAVPAFYIGKYPVTQAQYQAIVGKNPAFDLGARRPIENVSWHDAQLFCHKLSAMTDRRYRLPSEAEWEYACRAGTTTPFSCGESIVTEVANYNGDRSYANAPKGQYRERTSVVGSFPANDFGLFDMHGNVWEWCEDHWHSNYDGAPINGSARIDPQAQAHDARILRGGSWFRNPAVCRSAHRYKYASIFRYKDIGFRVVYAPMWNAPAIDKSTL
jgi:formylglycine-generating enzyme required for sulfatase activity